MPFDIYHDYIRSMKLIKASEKMDTIQAVSYPQSSDESRKKVWKELQKESRNGETKADTPEEIARKLKSWQMNV